MAWKNVNKDEFTQFIKTYPYPLKYDFYMDVQSWNDFRNDRVWPESKVAVAYTLCGDETYVIRNDYIKT